MASECGARSPQTGAAAGDISRDNNSNNTIGPGGPAGLVEQQTLAKLAARLDGGKLGPVRSHFESSASAHQILAPTQAPSAGMELVPSGGRGSDGGDSNCRSIKSSATANLATIATKTTPAHRELEVEWRADARCFSASGGGSSASLNVRTSLVKSIKSKSGQLPERVSLIGHTIKSFAGFVARKKNKLDEGVAPLCSCPLIEPSGANSNDSCRSTPSNPISARAKTQRREIGDADEEEDVNARDNDNNELERNISARSPPSSSNTRQQQQQRTTTMAATNSTTTPPPQDDDCVGWLTKSKSVVEDRATAATAAATTTARHTATTATTTRCGANRRSTYCSSIGAATCDINYDSSFSSAINCSGSNNTCAMNRTCSRDSNEKATADFGGLQAGCSDVGANQRGGNNGHNSNKSNQLKERENWKNIQFLLAVIGFAVDLGNVWRFPYICYKNGGGAFLIPYTIMFILGGLPIFYLEMSLGQYFSSGCLTVWRRVCPMAKGIGYAMCVLNFFTGLYYNTIISWAVFFFVESFTINLPWTSCSNSWNSDDCRTIEQRQGFHLINRTDSTPESLLLGNDTSTTTTDLAGEIHYSSPTKDYFEREVLQVHLSTGIDDLGLVRKPLAIYLAIVFVCIYFAIWKGVKSTGKAVWITALLPYFVLIPLLIRGVFLEGAWLGIRYYLYPDWSKIVDMDVWVEAAKQIYFSLGPGFGTLMALSSYNKFNHNCRKDALIAATVNYFASFISGLVIFAVLGYMATMEKVSINDVATEGPGLVFQVYPEGLATMRFSSIWSVLFFIMVITLGIDSTFGGLESVITGLCDEYPRLLRAHRGIFIGLLIILIYICSLPTTTYGGNYVIYVLESYGTSLSLLFIVLIETMIVCWLYGADRFCRNLEEMYGEKPGPYWRICWKYISPTILLIIFVAACGQELDKYHTLTNGSYTYPGWAPTLGLLMTGSSVCCIPIYAIYYLKSKTSGSFCERLKMACKPEGDKRRENQVYEDTSTDKNREENRAQLDTVI